MDAPPQSVTVLLAAAGAGEPGAEERLWQAVYAELKRMAGGKIAGCDRMQTTVLVHEVWMRMAARETALPSWEGRAHFFAAAAETMRRILVDQARRRLSRKRGGRIEHVPLEDDIQVAAPATDEKLLQIHEVLNELERGDKRKAQIVKLRFFAGFTNDETAAILEIHEKTVRREWALAKAWLFQAIQSSWSAAPFPPGGREAFE